MHTARWDHSVDLTGARVAVLGTGSTASQLLPEVAKVADKVYSCSAPLPGSCPSRTGPTATGSAGSSGGFRSPRSSTGPGCGCAVSANISVIENGSDKTQEFKDLSLRYLESSVADPELRSRLTPDHPLGCKRLVFAADYLSTLDPTARRGGVQSGSCTAARHWSPRTAPKLTWMWCCAPPAMPPRLPGPDRGLR